MTASRRLRFAAGALMVGGLALVTAPLAASAHSGNLFTWVYLDVDGAEPSGFATLSQTTALATTLGAQTVQELAADGADICTDETAWGIADLEGGYELFTWNHTTGVVGVPVPPVATLADFPEAETVSVRSMSAADSLPGCVKIAYVEYEVDYPEDPTEIQFTVSFVDTTTGAVHPITELETIDGQNLIEWEGIATDPTTGFTHLFAAYLGATYYAFLDIPDAQVSELRLMAGVPTALPGPGRPAEADFQPDGKLWLFYTQSEYDLLSFVPAADLTTAVPTVVGDANGTGPNGEHLHFPWTLTYDPGALPATGGAPLGAIALGGALMVGGVVLLAVRRRATA